ncbi:hypothetical protein ABIA20_000890 [Sinorhizobium fredii]
MFTKFTLVAVILTYPGSAVAACDSDANCSRWYPSEQGRGILGAARGNVGPWRSMRTRSTMPFWRCYG